MKEASKNMALRNATQITLLTTGRTLDIRAGDDPYWPNTERFNLAHGDADNILNYYEPETFDCVHSSHCLEHLYSPASVILDWWKLVRPRGYMNILVPDEELYELGLWPSRINSDHKRAFTLDADFKSTYVLDFTALAKSLPGASIEELCS